MNSSRNWWKKLESIIARGPSPRPRTMAHIRVEELGDRTLFSIVPITLPSPVIPPDSPADPSTMVPGESSPLSFQVAGTSGDDEIILRESPGTPGTWEVLVNGEIAETGDWVPNLSLEIDALAGDDEVTIQSSGQALFNSFVNIHGGEGDDVIRGGVASEFLWGDAGNDVITGGNSVDLLVGGEGDDELDGGSGDDFLVGNRGDDLLRGGAGNDQILGGDSPAVLNTFPTDHWRIDGQSGYIGAGIWPLHDGMDVLEGGAGNDVLSGGDENDILHGGAGDDQLGGGPGDDALLGGAGVDFLVGGPGTDNLDGGARDDTEYPGDGPLGPGPNAPEDVTVVAERGQVVVSWTDASDDEDGFGIEYRESGSSVPFIALTQVGADETQASISLVPGNYQLRVVALNRTGATTSAALEVEVSGIGTPPPSPPANVEVQELEEGKTIVSWEDTSDGEDGFRIEVTEEGSDVPMVFEVSADETAVPIGPLTPRSQYRIRVIAHAGTEEVSSEEVEYTAPGEVTGDLVAPTIADLFATTTSIEVTWGDLSDGETGFRVEYREAGELAFAAGPSVGPDVTLATIANLLPNTDYEVRVVVVAEDEEAASEVETVSTPEPEVPVPTQPSQVHQVTSTVDSIEISWTDHSDNESGFRIEYRLANSEDDFDELLADENATSATIDGLDSETEYEIRVVATGAESDSEPSDSIMVMTDAVPVFPPNAPSAPSVEVNRQQGNVVIRWSDMSDNEDGFTLEVWLAEGAEEDAESFFYDSNKSQSEEIPLDPGNYEYRIVAYNNDGESAPSRGSFAVPEVSPAKVENLKVENRGVFYVDLAWTYSDEFDSFRMYGRADGQSQEKLMDTYANGDTRQLGRARGKNLQANTLYHFRVVAVLNGVESDGVSIDARTKPTTQYLVQVQDLRRELIDITSVIRNRRSY